jgi:long-chain fatty acid transport protein
MFVPIPGHGTQTATGFGARIGMLWNATPEFSLGATYKTKTNMSKLGDYANDVLAYSEGKIDIPSEYGVGFAWKASPAVTLAADYLLVEYSGVKANQDPNGPGWKDQPIFRLGASWDVDSTWTLRGGLSSNKGQIESIRAAQNFMTPAINDKSYTFGATMKLDKASDISFSLEMNPSVTLDGTGPSTGVSITSKTQVFRVGYQKAF